MSIRVMRRHARKDTVLAHDMRNSRVADAGGDIAYDLAGKTETCQNRKRIGNPRDIAVIKSLSLSEPPAVARKSESGYEKKRGVRKVLRIDFFENGFRFRNAVSTDFRLRFKRKNCIEIIKFHRTCRIDTARERNPLFIFQRGCDDAPRFDFARIGYEYKKGM